MYFVLGDKNREIYWEVIHPLFISWNDIAFLRLFGNRKKKMLICFASSVVAIHRVTQ